MDGSSMTDPTQPTCGPLFLRALKHFTLAASDPVQLFSAGHMTGQAEKIYLGACPAAMFRPSEEYNAWCMQAADYLANLYALQVVVLYNVPEEIWLCHLSHVESLHSLRYEEVNSPAWHTLRGLLCGIPLTHIDMEFHRRIGYGKPCDKVRANNDAADASTL